MDSLKARPYGLLKKRKEKKTETNGFASTSHQLCSEQNQGLQSLTKEIQKKDIQQRKCTITPLA